MPGFYQLGEYDLAGFTVGVVEKEKMTDYLNQCRLLSHFCKQTFYEKIYEDKLNQL